jgi:hypothetical protein
MVANRTESQINAAKRAQAKRLGQSGASGMRKRCKKGKSCGASCINSGKVCLVDIPWATGNQISKVAKAIQSRDKKLSNEEIRQRGLNHLEQMKKSAIEGDGKAYNQHRDKVLEYKAKMKKRGVKGVDDAPLPKWDKLEPVVKELRDAIDKKDAQRREEAIAKLKELFSGKPKTEKPPEPEKPKVKEKGGPKPKLDKLGKESDFLKKESSSNGYYNPAVEDAHRFVRRLLGTGIMKSEVSYANEGQKRYFDELREKLLATLGQKKLSDTLTAIRDFTGGGYSAIREFQMGTGNSASARKHAKLLEAFIARKDIDKPRLEKFRGKKVDDAVLKGMIESAKANGTYDGKALSSWSTSLGTARGFADKKSWDNRNNRVIYRTINAKGVPVATVSSWTSENEILTPATAKYRYLDYRPITIGANTYHIFDVEEL